MHRAGRAFLGGAALLVFAGALWAHAVVVPSTTSTRAYETYTLRVPNEKDIPTVRVEIDFPPEVFVVSFAEVPGWTLDVQRDESGRAVRAAWSGSLPPNRFVELPFVGVNPAEPTTLVWNVDQVYRGTAGDEVVSWAGPEGSDFPASRTAVVAPGTAAAATEPTPGVASPAWLTLAALALSLAAVGLGLVALRRG